MTGLEPVPEQTCHQAQGAGARDRFPIRPVHRARPEDAVEFGLRSRGVGRLGPQARMAEVFAHRHQCGGQAAEALAFGDLGARGVDGDGPDGAGAGIAVHLRGQQPLRVVAAGTRAGAVAGRAPLKCK